MGCNCKEIEGFDAVLLKAIGYEKNTRNKAAIIKINNVASFTDLSNVKKVKGICCYYTTDRVEHKIPKTIKKVSKKTVKK